MFLAMGPACIYTRAHVINNGETSCHGRGYKDAQCNTTPVNGTWSARVEALYNDTRGTRTIAHILSTHQLKIEEQAEGQKGQKNSGGEGSTTDKHGNKRVIGGIRQWRVVERCQEEVCSWKRN